MNGPQGASEIDADLQPFMKFRVNTLVHAHSSYRQSAATPPGYQRCLKRHLAGSDMYYKLLRDAAWDVSKLEE